MKILPTVVFLVIVVGNVFLGILYFKQVIPSAKNYLENRLGVQIGNYVYSGFWRVADNESKSDQKSYGLLVAFCHFLLMLLFVICILMQILFFYLVARAVTGDSV